MGNNSKSKITPYLYLVPCMLIFGIFLFYPFVKTIYLSLYKTNKMGQAKLYVGLDNYKELLQSASFINSLKVTLIFVLIVVIGGIGSVWGALVAALLVGFADTFGKVLMPELAGLAVYLLMAVVLLWRPEGIFRKG